MPQSPIQVDVELHRLIEANRKTFDESQYQIVSRVLGESIATFVTGNLPFPTMEGERKRPRLSRRGGTYKLRMQGQSIVVHSLKDALKTAILLAEKTRPGFIQKLSQHRTSRGRRIVARQAAEIYPGNPHLVDYCAERLNEAWWYDTNISNAQCRRYLDILAQIGGFAPPQLTS